MSRGSRPRGPIDLSKAPPRRAVRVALAVRRRLRRVSDSFVPGEVLAYEDGIAFFRTRVAGALVDLGVVDALASGPRTSTELARELGLHADTLHRVLRLAAADDLLRLDDEGRFALTARTRALGSAASPTIGPWVSHLNTAAVQAAWADLPNSIRSGEPSFPSVHGRSIWAHFAENPEEERLFAGSMRELTALVLPWIVGGYPWPDSGVICDVAGGSGPVLAAVLAARPGLRGVLVEAPGVLPEADGYLTRAGIRDRVELREGDMFERIDAEAEIYVLKDILHDWDDDRCLQILATVRAAMPAGSRLVLVETLIGPRDSDPLPASVDVHMLTQCDGGRQRSAAELHALCSAAGLRPGGVHETGGPALVEALA